MKLFLVLATATLHALSAQENPIKEDAEVAITSNFELPKIQVVPITDTNANRQYELYIKLPEAYSENNDKSYPVIYTTDAMWHMEMLSGSTEYMLEDVILVGISWQKDINGDLKKEFGDHVSRYRDYSFRKHDNPEIQKKIQFGQANKHLDFIRNDVITYVDNTYRTDPNSRTYFGYSMGGEFGAYILLSQPDTFNNYILGSPSIKNEVEYLSELNTKFGPYEASNRSSSLNANVFISYGSLEEAMMEPIEAFIKLLNDRRDDGLTVLKEVIDGNHGTAFPMTVVRSISWLAQLNETVVKSPYLGQKPPGLVPKPFALGTVTSENWEYGGVFTPDLKEFYFIREVPGSEKQEFVVFEYKNEQWEESVISSRVGQPFISPDGKTMHLGKRYKKRTETGWSEIERLESPFEEIQIMRMTSSFNGTFVFDEIGMPNGDGVLRYSRLIEGKREAPRPFGKAINTGRMNAHPFIAPDESYLIFDGEREGGFGDSDLYISFRQQDGSWGTAINLGDAINTEAWEAAATVTPDGKYLFFNRNIGSDDYENVDIYWVDAQVIENLRPNNNKRSNLALLSSQIPTNTPLVFGEGIITVDSLLQGTITFNPEMTELFFARRKPEGSHNIYTSKLVDGKWSEPRPTFFSTNEEILDFHPHVTPKGDRLYFGSRRPLNGTAESPTLRQWYIEKKADNWGQPIPMEKPFEGRFIMRSTAANNGNLYFTSRENDDKPENEGIYIAINREGEYVDIERLGDAINGIGKWTAHPYIAPDESYMLFDSESDSGFGACDLYISFNKNGTWTKAQNLGPKINTELCEGGPSVSPDGKYLFFGRYNKATGLSKMFWVSTAAILNSD